MNQSFINKLSALVIASLVVVIGLVLLKTVSVQDATIPHSKDNNIIVYE